jgi:cobalt-zinc-cadmium efflux system protein
MTEHEHEHEHESSRGHRHHHHDHAAVPDRRDGAFAAGMALNIGFVAVGVVAGIIAHSTALLADAEHNHGDALGLGMAWGAAVLARRGPTARRTYGLRRTTILAGLTNALLILVAIGGVSWEAIRRLGEPHPVAGGMVAVVAAIGVAINGAAALLFARGRERDVNVRGAFLHLVGDAAVSAGVVVAGIVVWTTGWSWVDPVTSLLVSVVILVGTIALLRDALGLLLDVVPAHIDAGAVEQFLARLPGVVAVHDLHIWPMSTTETALTVHLVVPWNTCDALLVRNAAAEISRRFEIHHSTIQLDPAGEGEACVQGQEGTV